MLKTTKMRLDVVGNIVVLFILNNRFASGHGKSLKKTLRVRNLCEDFEILLFVFTCVKIVCC